MIFYALKQNMNKAIFACYKKWYAKAVSAGTIDMDALAEHMSNHNSPYSKGVIKGILTDMVTCIKELLLDGKRVRIDDLAVFSVAIRNKKGCENKADYKVNEYVDAVKLNALAIGELAYNQLNLDATLKRSPLDKDDDTSTTTGSGGTTSGGTSSGTGNSLQEGLVEDDDLDDGENR